MFVVETLVSGLLFGATYSLVAIGFTLIFGVMNRLNIAHGAITMVAAFGGAAISLRFGGGDSYWILFLAFVASVVTGARDGARGSHRGVRPAAQCRSAGAVRDQRRRHHHARGTVCSAQPAGAAVLAGILPVPVAAGRSRLSGRRHPDPRRLCGDLHGRRAGDGRAALVDHPQPHGAGDPGGRGERHRCLAARDQCAARRGHGVRGGLGASPARPAA